MEIAAERRVARKVRVGGFKRFWQTRSGLVLGLGSLTIVTIIWELITGLGYIDKLFLGRPSDIARVYWEMFVETGEIYPHLSISFQEALFGFVSAVVVGVLFGLLIGRFRYVRELTEPFIMALYSTPTVALLPLFILWLGIGLWSKVLLIFLGGVFAVLVNTQTGVENTNQRLIETARAFTANERQIFTKIILPSAVPFIVAGIRLAIGRILITVFVAEMYASTKGIGFLIVQAGATYKTAQLFVGVLILTVTGVLLSQLLRIVEERKFGHMRER